MRAQRRFEACEILQRPDGGASAPPPTPPRELLVTTLEVDDVPSSFTSVSALYDAAGAQFIAFAFAVARFVAIDTPTIVALLFLVAAIVLLPFTTASVGDPDVADLPCRPC